MPRERIPTCTPVGRVVGTDEEIPTPPWDVTVTWHRDGGVVQIATLADDADERLRNWTELDAAAVQAAGQPAVTTPGMPPAAITVASGGAVSTKPGTSFKTFGGWHVDLDRRSVNELIKKLRVARDQAFGRDE